MVVRDGGRTRGFGRVLVLTIVLGSSGTWAVGCGGSSTSGGEAGKADGGSAGTDAGTGGSTGGTTGKGGSSGAAQGGTGTGGVVASGGSAGGTSKGGTGAGGSVGKGGTSGVGGGCLLDCDDIPCPDGMLVSPGECQCPVCSCEEVACPASDCSDGQVPIMKPGACCPICPPDIDACETDSDCVMAWSTLECCGCPTAVSRAHYENDLCLVVPGEMREIPDKCAVPCPAIVCAECREATPICAGGTCMYFYGPPDR